MFLLAIGTVAFIAACAGSKSISVGGGDDASTSPTPGPTPPTQDTFSSKVQPWMTAQACGVAGCHTATNGQGAIKLSLALPPASVADSSANFAESKCNDHLIKYGAAPTGKLLSYFCTNATTPLGTAHNAKTASAQNCTDLYAWAAEGSGNAPACP